MGFTFFLLDIYLNYKMKKEKGDVCVGCTAPLQIPHIQCTVCTENPVLICLRCFSKGFESETHHNNHCYTVVVSIPHVYESFIRFATLQLNNYIIRVTDLRFWGKNEYSSSYILLTKTKNNCVTLHGISICRRTTSA